VFFEPKTKRLKARRQGTCDMHSPLSPLDQPLIKIKLLTQTLFKKAPHQNTKNSLYYGTLIF